MPGMKRREFITLLGGAAAAWPLAARAQQAGKLPTIGYLGGGTPTSQRAWVAAFVQRLRELGWIEGRTVAIEYRWGEGRAERYAEIAAEFVRLKVDVILAGGTEAAIAAKQATSVIPIVFPTAGDPIGSGLVASLARPGGNVTGLSNLGTDLACQTPRTLARGFPSLRRLAVMANADYSGGVTEMSEIDAAARTLGLEVVPLPIRRAEDIAPAFEALKGRAEALYVIGDPLVNTHRLRINTFALAARLPTMFAQREYVEAAGLMSYGANFPDLNRRAADYVDKILRGAKPADIPVEQPTKFDLVINLKTAKALGLDRAADAARPRRRGDRIGRCLLQCLCRLMGWPGRAQRLLCWACGWGGVTQSSRSMRCAHLRRRRKPSPRSGSTSARTRSTWLGWTSGAQSFCSRRYPVVSSNAVFPIFRAA